MDDKQKKSRAGRGLGKEPFQGEEETGMAQGGEAIFLPASARVCPLSRNLASKLRLRLSPRGVVKTPTCALFLGLRGAL